MKLVMCIILFLLGSCSSKQGKPHLKPLTELTFLQTQEPLKVTNLDQAYFETNPQYILDLYFLLANDAFYLGCLEIAHNGFVFLYENDARNGNREFLKGKFELLHKILRYRALYLKDNKNKIEEFNNVLGFRCKELKESLN